MEETLLLAEHSRFNSLSDSIYVVDGKKKYVLLLLTIGDIFWTPWNVLRWYPASRKLFSQRASSKMFDRILNTLLIRIFVIDKIKEDYPKLLFKCNMNIVWQCSKIINLLLGTVFYTFFLLFVDIPMYNESRIHCYKHWLLVQLWLYYSKRTGKTL